MRLKLVTAVSVAALWSTPIFADDAASAPAEGAAENAEAAVDEKFEADIAYIDALVDGGYPDLAELQIATVRANTPPADKDRLETRLFAIEVKGLINLGKMEEAERKIAALPDRKSPKYWAARLEVANNYAVRNRKDECKKIYEEFFKAYPSPTKDLVTFYMQACFQWGQILVKDNRFAEAAEVYEQLLKQKLTTSQWCMMACETTDLYIRLVNDPKTDKKKVAEYLARAEALADQILKHDDQPVFFGRALSTKAHCRALAGDVQEAKDIIDEFLEPLSELHDSIVANDPYGAKGLRKMSPLPQCRFVLGEILWNEAKAEYAKGEKDRDDELVKGYLFGVKDPDTGKRDGLGAYNHMLNIFMNYPECAWASRAMQLEKEIVEFAKDKYGAKIDSKVTVEHLARIVGARIRTAQALADDGNAKEGIKELYAALKPERKEDDPEAEYRLPVIEALCKLHHEAMAETKDQAEKDALRLDLDAIESYLTERFAGNPDKLLMTKAGEYALRVAAFENERGEPMRAAAMRRAFGINYRKHANAAGTLAGMAGEAQKVENWATADELWTLIEQYHTNSTYYAISYHQRSLCAKGLGDSLKEREMMQAYVDNETKPVQKLQARLSLAQMYQKDGIAQIKAAEDIEDEEERKKAVKEGEKTVTNGIKQFREFVKRSNDLIADPTVEAADKEKYTDLKDTAMFLEAECWCRLRKREVYRAAAAQALEAYVKDFPTGKYAKNAYVKLSMMYTLLKQPEKSQDALERLSKYYADSPEAKNAVPQLAKSFMELGLKAEGAELYAKMLKTDGQYSARQYLDAGDALLEARQWDMCNQAYDKAVRLVTPEQTQTAFRARLGSARALYAQSKFALAHQEIDKLLADEKMAKQAVASEAYLLLVEVAMKEGRIEQDADRRDRCYKAAGGAVKKLRPFYAKKEKFEIDGLDLMSVDVLIARMLTEEEMGQKESAAETRGKAAGLLVAFIGGKGPNEGKIEELSDGERKNLAKAYELLLPLLKDMGSEQSEDIITYGGEYLKYFPYGEKVSDIQNIMNQARANLPKEKGAQK